MATALRLGQYALRGLVSCSRATAAVGSGAGTYMWRQNGGVSGGAAFAAVVKATTMTTGFAHMIRASTAARVNGARMFGSEGSSYLDREEVTARVLDVVKKFDKVDGSKVTPTSNFKTDLGLDSLDETEVVMAFEEEFSVDIPDVEADKIKSIEDAINFVTADPNAK